MSIGSSYVPHLSVADRCAVLLDFADDLYPVDEPAGDCLAEWESWRQALVVRRYVGSLLDG